jgi:hypothetical protein
MLYDRLVDTEENVNISELPENEKIFKKLHDKLINHLERREKIIQ